MISIIVPYWNSEQWLGRCCESLTKQKGDFEFIFVDDMSTDNGADVVCEYRDKDDRFISLYNTRSKGVSGARNTGIKWAHGEWITFLDSDDELLDNAYETFGHAKGNVTQFNHLRYYTEIDKLALKYTNTGGWYSVDNLPVHWFGVWNKIFKADFLSDIRFDEGLQYGEDGLFVFACLAKDPRIYHAEKRLTTVKHRFDNKESLSRSKTADDLLTQIHAYESFMLKQTDPNVRIALCKELSNLWGAPRVEKALGNS